MWLPVSLVNCGKEKGINPLWQFGTLKFRVKAKLGCRVANPAIEFLLDKYIGGLLPQLDSFRT